MKYKYIHTIEGHPAVFADNQICYATRGKRGAVKIVETLEQIKREQKASTRWRKSKGWTDSRNYGWVKIECN